MNQLKKRSSFSSEDLFFFKQIPIICFPLFFFFLQTILSRFIEFLQPFCCRGEGPRYLGVGCGRRNWLKCLQNWLRFLCPCMSKKSCLCGTAFVSHGTAHSWKPADRGLKKLMTGLAPPARRAGESARLLSAFVQNGCCWQHPSPVPTFYLFQLILGRSVKGTRKAENLHVLNKPVGLSLDQLPATSLQVELSYRKVFSFDGMGAQRRMALSQTLAVP